MGKTKIGKIDQTGNFISDLEPGVMYDEKDVIEVATSPAGKLTQPDLKSLTYTLLIVAASAVITKLLEVLPGIAITGSEQEIFMATLIMVLKFLQKVLSNREYVV